MKFQRHRWTHCYVTFNAWISGVNQLAANNASDHVTDHVTDTVRVREQLIFRCQPTKSNHVNNHML